MQCSRLQDLCKTCGSAEAQNARVFKSLQDAITDSPASLSSTAIFLGGSTRSAAQTDNAAMPVRISLPCRDNCMQDPGPDTCGQSVSGLSCLLLCSALAEFWECSYRMA